jgi:hypothetical protein
VNSRLAWATWDPVSGRKKYIIILHCIPDDIHSCDITIPIIYSVLIPPTAILSCNSCSSPVSRFNFYIYFILFYFNLMCMFRLHPPPGTGVTDVFEPPCVLLTNVWSLLEQQIFITADSSLQLHLIIY